ncbi:thioredoxin domain-containing protein 8 isoform X2 [Zalophus californianus]|uniref:Thioredoxin domain-containing protein 8 isoform X2 n=1 Tax=Zalophus californianus TaxID=9704 RepID=A0A6J2ETS8_ZALCA|nr:thioredoxin domain-containing protein 8 isoform X2 [Zalophus californianus]
MVQIIKDVDELKTFLKAAGCKLVVVEFSAKWCGPCQRMYPLVHAMSLQYRNVMFANVDVDDSRSCATITIINFRPFHHSKKTKQNKKLLLEFQQSPPSTPTLGNLKSMFCL